MDMANDVCLAGWIVAPGATDTINDVDLDSLSASQRFFYDHAGWSFDPSRETPRQGRVRCAKALAAAEQEALRQGWQFELERSGEQYDWDGSTFDVVAGGACDGYDASLYDESGDLLASLGGVTFADNNPRKDPYRRVVAAELAREAIEVPPGSLLGGAR
jgi:hypothetical protein